MTEARLNWFALGTATVLLCSGCSQAPPAEPEAETTASKAEKSPEVDRPAKVVPPAPAAVEKTPVRTEMAEDITLQLADPNELQEFISGQQGNVVVVDFWATWCIPCLKNFPHTVDWSRKYREKGLTVVSVCIDDTDDEKKTKALAQLRRLGARFPNFLSRLGGDEEAFEAFGVSAGLPIYRVYARDGSLIRQFTNEDPENPYDHSDVESAIQSAL